MGNIIYICNLFKTYVFFMTKLNCLQLDRLTKRYRNAEVDSLKDVSFSIYKGEKFGILGPNGAGKTTLISILCGILPQTSGKYSFYRDNKELRPFDIKQCLGFVPQEYAFYEELTPVQNMNYFGALYNLSKQDIKTRTDEIFAVLGLCKIANKKVKIFSGGMKRRMNLAIGILHKPEMLFLDEPTVGSDVQSKHAMIEYLKKINQEGTTIVYSSHLMAEAESLCDRIAFINQGKLIVCDHISELLQKHKAPDLETLFIQLTGAEYFDVYEQI